MRLQIMRNGKFFGDPREDMTEAHREIDRLRIAHPFDKWKLVPYTFTEEEDKEIEAAVYQMLDNLDNRQPRLF